MFLVEWGRTCVLEWDVMVFICSKMPLIDKLELQRDKVYENWKSDHFSALSQENEESWTKLQTFSSEFLTICHTFWKFLPYTSVSEQIDSSSRQWLNNSMHSFLYDLLGIFMWFWTENSLKWITPEKPVGCSYPLVLFPTRMIYPQTVSRDERMDVQTSNQLWLFYTKARQRGSSCKGWV